MIQLSKKFLIIFMPENYRSAHFSQFNCMCMSVLYCIREYFIRHANFGYYTPQPVWTFQTGNTQNKEMTVAINTTYCNLIWISLVNCKSGYPKHITGQITFFTLSHRRREWTERSLSRCKLKTDTKAREKQSDNVCRHCLSLNIICFLLGRVICCLFFQGVVNFMQALLSPFYTSMLLTQSNYHFRNFPNSSSNPILVIFLRFMFFIYYFLKSQRHLLKEL